MCFRRYNNKQKYLTLDFDDLIYIPAASFTLVNIIRGRFNRSLMFHSPHMSQNELPMREKEKMVISTHGRRVKYRRLVKSTLDDAHECDGKCWEVN